MNNIRRKQKEYTNFIESSQNNISKYFDLNENIKCTLKEKINIQVTIFSVEYGDVFKLTCSINYPHSYPFVSPYWCIKECIIKEDFQSIYLKDYYYKIVNNHNNLYKKEWSVFITLEKDILIFLTRINHFEYIFYNSYIKFNNIRNHFINIVTEELMMIIWHPSRYEFWKNYDSDIISF